MICNGESSRADEIDQGSIALMRAIACHELVVLFRIVSIRSAIDYEPNYSLDSASSDGKAELLLGVAVGA
jgi:hypothetical protein